jgi:hypothetical protein
MDARKRWIQEHPEAHAAHTALATAVRAGRIKSEPCALCESTPTQAHHADYSKPLEVTWLCQTCHQRLHADERAGGTLAPYSTRRRPPKQAPRFGCKKFQPAPKRGALQARAIELRSAGRSYSQIAAELGISIGTAYKWLNLTPYK